MNRLAPTLALLVLAPPAAAQPVEWSRAPRVEVALSSFKYRPRTIRLAAGRPVVLRLVNAGSGGHDFTARAFFAAATLRTPVPGGKVELKGGQSREVALVPKAGRYKVKCTHTLHQTFGMTGEIIVQ